MGIIDQNSCCGYGTAGTKTGGYDCIDIPGAVTGTMMTKGAGERFCGRNLVTAAGAVSKTICSKNFQVKKNWGIFFKYFLVFFLGANKPFRTSFISDSFEFVDSMESKKPGLGVKLQYMLVNC